MDSVKDEIIKYLNFRGYPVYGGTLEFEVAAKTKHKPSNVSRRCRELVKEGRIIPEYEFLENDQGRLVRVVKYSLPEIKQTALL